MRNRLVIVCLAFVPFAVACDQDAHHVNPDADGDNDGDADTGADGDADADADGDAEVDGAPEPQGVVFQVRTGRSWSGATPLAGSPARSIVDGLERSLTADDDGRINLGAVDWSSVESLVVTFYPEGYPVITYAWLTEAWVEELIDADGTIHVRFDEPQPERTVVTTEGTAVNMLDEGHYLTVGAIGFNNYHTGLGPDWAVGVSAGEPITLVALEFGGGGRAGPRGVNQILYRWVVAEHPAITEDTTVELDMSDVVETVSVSGSFTIPERGSTDFFEVATPYLEIRTDRDIHMGAFIGFLTIGAVTGPNLYEYDGEYAVVDSVDRPITRYLMYLGELTSNIYVDGYPEGRREAPFLEPPELESSQEDLSWTIDESAAVDPTVRCQLVVSELSGAALTPCHIINLPKEVTTVERGEMPPLPGATATCGRSPFANVQLSEEGELYGEAAQVRFTASVYTSVSP